MQSSIAPGATRRRGRGYESPRPTKLYGIGPLFSMIMGLVAFGLLRGPFFSPLASSQLRLAPTAQHSVVRALNRAGFTVATQANGGPAVFAVQGSPDRPVEVSFLGHAAGTPPRLYVVNVNTTGSTTTWTASGFQVLAGPPSAEVTTLNGFGGTLFYTLAISHQVETLVARDVTGGGSQTFGFDGPAHAVSVAPHGSVPVRLAVVRWTDLAGHPRLALLQHGTNGWTSSSRSLTLVPTTGPTTSPFVHVVEWTRDHLGPKPVALIEDAWYTIVDFTQRTLYWQTHAKPAAAPAVSSVHPNTSPVASGSRPTSGASSPSAGAAPNSPPCPTAVRAVVPPPSATPAPPRLPRNLVVPAGWPQAPGEGVWTPVGQLVGGKIAMERTFLLPDPQRPYARVDLVWIDPNLARPHLVAGTRHPQAASGLRGPGVIPWADRSRLLAAFNGGFKRIGGHYQGFGFRTNGEWYIPPTRGLATLTISATGKVAIGSWGIELPTTPAPPMVMQNLPLLVDHGHVSARIDDHAFWGITVDNAVRVWRSGLGQTAGGQLIYAAGTPVTARGMAEALAAAGARRAMELDINSYWVTFNLYTPNAPGSAHVTGHKLMPDMTRSADRYLQPDRRSFVYLTAATPPKG